MAATISCQLYDQLLAQEVESSLDTQRICLILNDLSSDHGQIILALILHHYQLHGGSIAGLLKQNNGKRMILPYDGKTMTGSKGPRFTYRLLPPSLQRVIANYLSISA